MASDDIMAQKAVILQLFRTEKFSEALLLFYILEILSKQNTELDSVYKQIKEKFSSNRSNPKKPHFLCIGAQKAATSWLFLNLQKNPDIWMPPVKELHFFDYLFVNSNRKWTEWHIKKGVKECIIRHIQNNNCNLDYIHYLLNIATNNLFSENWYFSTFNYPDSKNKLCGDITPEYCTIQRHGIEYLLYLIPDIKIIYVIRDPYERAISQVSMLAKSSNLKPDDKEGLLRIIHSSEILNRGNYKTYVPQWDEYFTQDKILYLPFGLINMSPEAYLKTVEDFLCISHLPPSAIIRKKVWQSDKFEIPEEGALYLREICNEQNEFLSQRFSREFVQLLK